MAGNVQATQVNLESRVGNTTRLGGLVNTIKQYATKLVVATALVAGAGYVSGCGEESECCKEMKCGSAYTCVDHYDDTCECKYDSPGPSFMTQEYGLSMDDVFENDTTTYDGN